MATRTHDVRTGQPGPWRLEYRPEWTGQARLSPAPALERVDRVSTPLSQAQHRALYLLKLARKDDPNTDDGVMTNEATFYDKEIAVAFVHWRTARALKRRGLITYGASDPEWGTELKLGAGAHGAGDSASKPGSSPVRQPHNAAQEDAAA